MSISRQQRRYQERQAIKAARKTGHPASGQASPEKFEQMRKRPSLGKILSGIAAVLSIGASCYLFWPSLDVVAVPWDNSTHAFAAKFEFRNTGRLPLRDVSFSCLANNATQKNISTDGASVTYPVTGERGQVIGDLAAGAFVTRSCGGGTITIGPHPSNLRIDAVYTWPWIGRHIPLTRYFVSETDGRRTWMTPEKPPSP